MIVSDEGQARVFLIYILFGIGCIMLSDLFGIFIKRFGSTRARVNMLDILYFAMAFCLILYAGVKFNFGALRYYQLFGLVIGMVMQKLLFSGICRKGFEVLVSVCISIGRLVIRNIWRIISLTLHLVFTMTDFIEDKIMFFCRKASARAKKVKMKKAKKKKTVKKRLEMI